MIAQMHSIVQLLRHRDNCVNQHHGRDLCNEVCYIVQNMARLAYQVIGNILLDDSVLADPSDTGDQASCGADLLLGIKDRG